MIGATLDANMAVSSVVSAHTAALVLVSLPLPGLSKSRRQRKSSPSAASAVSTNPTELASPQEL
jgi:hypothetical protein